MILIVVAVRSQTSLKLYDHLAVRKVCSGWIPHHLTNTKKDARVDWCTQMLKKYNDSVSNDVYKIVPGEESFEPEHKLQSTLWVFQDESNLTKVVLTWSTALQMGACLFGKAGHVAAIQIALQERKTVNSK
ncbi:uncharacterized protein LOC119688184 [Teleopsis dalmanni]|uniref:uncharacterized protein LOC119664975 n=1 Tax=Teleopsis dalmanni TaxID=139649 RepID=UPI0018CD38D7|nr:uncharacterized protein LOC119664975 [Teleopsis dalmanni]XP_037958796.1 uncharacterized protein LOC119688184 [Teleopsis dalmanni]